MEKLSDSHSSFLAGSLLIARRREGVDRPTLSKARNTYRSLEARWHLRRSAPPETTKYTFDLELEQHNNRAERGCCVLLLRAGFRSIFD